MGEREGGHGGHGSTLPLPQRHRPTILKSQKVVNNLQKGGTFLFTSMNNLYLPCVFFGEVLHYILEVFIMPLGTELISESESTDFYFEVARGRVRGHEAVFIGSRLPVLNISDGSIDVWTGGGVLGTLDAPDIMKVSSTSADDVRLIGSGARTMLLTGLDGDYNAQSETIELLGVSSAFTVNEYLRVFSLESILSGDDDRNIGDISVFDDTGGTLQCHCVANKNISEDSQYTVAAGHSLQLIQAVPNVTRLVGGGNVCSLLVGQSKVDIPGTNFSRLREIEVQIDTGMGNHPAIDLSLSDPVPEFADIRIQALTDKDATEVRMTLTGILYINGIR